MADNPKKRGKDGKTITTGVISRETDSSIFIRKKEIHKKLIEKVEMEHKMNDQRARLKKEINILCNSRILEEKQFKNYSI